MTHSLSNNRWEEGTTTLPPLERTLVHKQKYIIVSVFPGLDEGTAWKKDESKIF